ncbi:MAG: hypothetical protein R6T78_01530 [Dehalococcoidales bacterium]
MEAIYDKGQHVSIISVKDKHGNKKYPHNEKYVGQGGVVLDSFYLGAFHVLYYKDHLPEDAFIYKVRLDEGNTVVTVAEEELKPAE